MSATSAMSLTVVGCSGSYPGPDSPASCYLVTAEHEGRPFRLLLDLGSGALGALHRHVDPLSIDAVLISHTHADHCLDLCGYWVMRTYHPDGPQPVLAVHGPVGTAARMARAYDLDEDPGMTAQFDFVDHVERTSIGPFTVTTTRVCHPVPAFAIRLDVGGRSLVYSGDTGPCSQLDALASGADLLLCEASFREGHHNPPDLHMTGREAGECARVAEVGRLLVTHVPPWHDRDAVLGEAKQVFAGALDLARAGETYEV